MGTSAAPAGVVGLAAGTTYFAIGRALAFVPVVGVPLSIAWTVGGAYIGAQWLKDVKKRTYDEGIKLDKRLQEAKASGNQEAINQAKIDRASHTVNLWRNELPAEVAGLYGFGKGRGVSNKFMKPAPRGEWVRAGRFAKEKIKAPVEFINKKIFPEKWNSNKIKDLGLSKEVLDAQKLSEKDLLFVEGPKEWSLGPEGKNLYRYDIVYSKEINPLTKKRDLIGRVITAKSADGKGEKSWHVRWTREAWLNDLKMKRKNLLDTNRNKDGTLPNRILEVSESVDSKGNTFITETSWKKDPNSKSSFPYEKESWTTVEVGTDGYKIVWKPSKGDKREFDVWKKDSPGYNKITKEVTRENIRELSQKEKNKYKLDPKKDYAMKDNVLYETKINYGKGGQKTISLTVPVVKTKTKTRTRTRTEQTQIQIQKTKNLAKQRSRAIEKSREKIRQLQERLNRQKTLLRYKMKTMGKQKFKMTEKEKVKEMEKIEEKIKYLEKERTKETKKTNKLRRRGGFGFPWRFGMGGTQLGVAGKYKGIKHFQDPFKRWAGKAKYTQSKNFDLIKKLKGFYG